MNPAFSVVVFTTLAGAAQGLVAALAVAVLAGALPAGASFLGVALAVAEVMLLVSLGASFLHLGRPERAWRAVLMWRTSWLSREVIVLPAFMAAVALWWLMLQLGHASALWPLLALALALLLWYCTAMIYACIRFIQEWAHPLTLINYLLIGLSSGLVLTGALAVADGEAALAAGLTPWALLVTLAAWGTRILALRRNALLAPRSTLQSATGIQATKLRQTSMGMSGGAFNTREFFHRASRAAFRGIKHAFLVLGFALPTALLLGLMAGAPAALWLLALPLQYVGLLAERWFFFAQARHPQNLYYQTVS